MEDKIENTLNEVKVLQVCVDDMTTSIEGLTTALNLTRKYGEVYDFLTRLAQGEYSNINEVNYEAQLLRNRL